MPFKKILCKKLATVILCKSNKMIFPRLMIYAELQIMNKIQLVLFIIPKFSVTNGSRNFRNVFVVMFFFKDQNTLFCRVGSKIHALLSTNCVCTLCGYMITLHSTAVKLTKCIELSKSELQ